MKSVIGIMKISKLLENGDLFLRILTEIAKDISKEFTSMQIKI